MRLMIGEKEPCLLVEVREKYSSENMAFKFTVINGSWEGYYTKGEVFLKGEHIPTYMGMKILSDNQDRLRGDYNAVFANWDNPDYVAPVAEKINFQHFLDDDTPF